jgi:hypothetical protein
MFLVAGARFSGKGCDLRTYISEKNNALKIGDQSNGGQKSTHAH